MKNQYHDEVVVFYIEIARDGKEYMGRFCYCFESDVTFQSSENLLRDQLYALELQ
jgi:hypothetical protein